MPTIATDTDTLLTDLELDALKASRNDLNILNEDIKDKLTFQATKNGKERSIELGRLNADQQEATNRFGKLMREDNLNLKNMELKEAELSSSKDAKIKAAQFIAENAALEFEIEKFKKKIEIEDTLAQISTATVAKENAAENATLKFDLKKEKIKNEVAQEEINTRLANGEPYYKVYGINKWYLLFKQNLGISFLTVATIICIVAAKLFT